MPRCLPSIVMPSPDPLLSPVNLSLQFLVTPPPPPPCPPLHPPSLSHLACSFFFFSKPCVNDYAPLMTRVRWRLARRRCCIWHNQDGDVAIQCQHFNIPPSLSVCLSLVEFFFCNCFQTYQNRNRSARARHTHTQTHTLVLALLSCNTVPEAVN